MNLSRNVVVVCINSPHIGNNSFWPIIVRGRLEEDANAAREFISRAKSKSTKQRGQNQNIDAQKSRFIMYS